MMLQTIMAFNPSVNARDKFGRTPLHLAAAVGNMTALNHIIQRGMPQNNPDGSLAYEPAEPLQVDA